jgi:hypothetical protein
LGGKRGDTNHLPTLMNEFWVQLRCIYELSDEAVD